MMKILFFSFLFSVLSRGVAPVAVFSPVFLGGSNRYEPAGDRIRTHCGVRLWMRKKEEMLNAYVNGKN